MFELFDNDAPTLEFGRIPFERGQRFNYEQFFRNVVEESKTPLREQKVYKRLREFHASDDLSILNYGKLEPVLVSRD